MLAALTSCSVSPSCDVVVVGLRQFFFLIVGAVAGALPRELCETCERCEAEPVVVVGCDGVWARPGWRTVALRHDHVGVEKLKEERNEAHHRPISAYSCPLRGNGLFDMKMTPPPQEHLPRGPMRPHQRRLRSGGTPNTITAQVGGDASPHLHLQKQTSRATRANNQPPRTHWGMKQDPGSAGSLLLLPCCCCPSG